MKKFKGILLCTDVDGTLLSSDGGISDKNRKAIEHFKREGGMFTFITGRVPLTSQNIWKMIEPNISFGCINGGGVYDHKKSEYKWITLAPTGIIDIAEYVYDNMPDMGIQVNTPDNIYTCNNNSAMERFYQITGIAKNYCKLDQVKEGIVKIIFGDEVEQNIQKLSELLKSHPLACDFDFVRSEKTLYEILPKGINKGTALKKLCELMDLDINKTIAVGDYDNDIGMLNAAKIGIAVSNATDNAKAAADMVTVSNDENAIAKIIEDLENNIIIL